MYHKKHLIKKAGFTETLEEIGKALGITIGTGLGLAGVGFAAEKITDAIRKKNAYNKFIEQYPDLKSNPNTQEIIDAVYDISPTVATNPKMLFNIVKSESEYGISLTPDTLRTLSSIESGKPRTFLEYSQHLMPAYSYTNITIPKTVKETKTK
jgi:hypothetical protein